MCAGVIDDVFCTRLADHMIEGDRLLDRWAVNLRVLAVERKSVAERVDYNLGDTFSVIELEWDYCLLTESELIISSIIIIEAMATNGRERASMAGML